MMKNNGNNKKNNIKEILMKNSKILISTVVLLIMLVAATVAWYVLQNNAIINPFKDQLEPFEFIVTSIDEADSNDPNNRKFSITPEKFANVNEGKMAPGTFGYSYIYIRSNLAETYNVYLDDSRLSFKIPIKDDSGNEVVNLQNEKVTYQGSSKEKNIYDFTYLIKKHFRFFVVENNKRIEFTSDKPYEGKLSEQCIDTTLKKQGYKKGNVKVNWEWLYDAYDYLIPSQTDAVGNPVSNAKWRLPDSDVNDYMTDEELNEYVEAWDHEDNFISKYVSYINGEVEFTVTGSQAKPVQ